MVFLDNKGWPVVWIKERPVISVIRRIIFTRKIITRVKWDMLERKRLDNGENTQNILYKEIKDYGRNRINDK